MRNSLFLIVFSVLLAHATAAQTSAPAPRVPEDGVYQVVDQMPEFPGGMPGLQAYLSASLQYPEGARQAKVTGTVFVGFVVGQDGSIREIVILRGIGHGCDEEVLRVVGAMPAWKAGMHQGRTVSVRFSLPVQFIFR